MLIRALKLAWANVTNHWQRLMVRCAGITFAVVLMFMQTGFRNALFDSNVRIAEQIDVDIVLRTRSRFMLSSGQTMTLDDIVKARSVAGVQVAEPMYIETRASYFRSPNQPARRIRVLAFDVSSEMFDKLNVARFAKQLHRNDCALFDVKSKSIYQVNDFVAGEVAVQSGELSDRAIQLVGRFTLGIDFTNNGNLIMSPESFERYFPLRGRGRPLLRPDYGLIRCRDRSDVDAVVERLRAVLGPDVLVDSKSSFIGLERHFWGSNTPIGLIFGVGTIIGFVVGLIICYQVLATDIAEQLSEFATLKAMGYSAWYFTSVVVCQALILSMMAFLPGTLITVLAFSIVNLSTGLFMSLNVARLSLVLFLTMAMCVLSGLIALRKLLAADPASLF